jgi:hypothetical protein
MAHNLLTSPASIGDPRIDLNESSLRRLILAPTARTLDILRTPGNLRTLASGRTPGNSGIRRSLSLLCRPPRRFVVMRPGRMVRSGTKSSDSPGVPPALSASSPRSPRPHPATGNDQPGSV